MADEMTCIICEATFRPSAMAGEKCKPCALLYPKANSRADIKKKNSNTPETLTEKRVKALIYEILEEANIKRFECDKCKELFFKTSPAQRQCLACKEKENK